MQFLHFYLTNISIEIKKFDLINSISREDDDKASMILSSIRYNDDYVNTQDNLGKTALMHSIQLNNDKMSKLILRKNPDLNLTDNSSCNSLFYAIYYNNLNITKSILKRDFDINVKNSFGETALMCALYFQNKEIIKLILKQKPNLEIKDNKGNNGYDYGRFFNIDLKGMLEEIEYENSKYDLINNIERNNIEKSIEILNNIKIFDSYLDIQNKLGKTALMFAAQIQNEEIVNAILERKPRLNIQNIDGWSALHYSTHYQNYNITKMILEKNPNINLQDKYQMTPLMFAIISSNEKIIKLILEKNPDLYLSDINGRTAFGYARFYGVDLDKLIKEVNTTN